jgi:hypothetical protein
MREEELIALLPTIAEELTAIQFRNDLEQLDFILADLLAEDKVAAYEALGTLEDLLAEILSCPSTPPSARRNGMHAGVTFAERRALSRWALEAAARCESPLTLMAWYNILTHQRVIDRTSHKLSYVKNGRRIGRFRNGVCRR